MRIAIVNDLNMAVEALRRALARIPDVDVAWIAEDGCVAVEKCLQDRPDLILMDMVMPRMDGVEATRQIMQQCPCPILITTVSVQTNIDRVYEALGLGALDAVNTPTFSPTSEIEGLDALARKIRYAARVDQVNDSLLSRRRPKEPAPDSTQVTLPPLVAIGASTGGPQTLRTILASLTRPLSFSIVIVQHLGTSFVPGFAGWLGRETGLEIEVARPGTMALANRVYIACCDDHLILDSRGRFDHVRQPANCIHRPSVDVLFESLAGPQIPPGVAVLLTGMGRDGAVGLQTLQQRGWKTIAQDKATSVIWGMPGYAVQLNAADQVLSDQRIGPAIELAGKHLLRRRVP